MGNTASDIVDARQADVVASSDEPIVPRLELGQRDLTGPALARQSSSAGIPTLASAASETRMSSSRSVSNETSSASADKVSALALEQPELDERVRRMLEETGETAAVAAHVMALSDANKRLLLSGHQVCG